MVQEVFTIGGEDFTREDLVAKHGAEVADIIIRNYKTEADMIDKTARTELSRAKRQFREKQIADYLSAHPEIEEGFEPFTGKLEDFIPDAEAKVKAGKGQRT